MELKELQKANHYRTILLTNEDALNAFIANPKGELDKNAGITINDEQHACVNQYIAASMSMMQVFKFPTNPGPWDPTGEPPVALRKAPWWVHVLVDVLWTIIFG